MWSGTSPDLERGSHGDNAAAKTLRQSISKCDSVPRFIYLIDQVKRWNLKLPLKCLSVSHTSDCSSEQQDMWAVRFTGLPGMSEESQSDNPSANCTWSHIVCVRWAEIYLNDLVEVLINNLPLYVGVSAGSLSVQHTTPYKETVHSWNSAFWM